MIDDLKYINYICKILILEMLFDYVHKKALVRITHKCFEK